MQNEIAPQYFTIELDKHATMTALWNARHGLAAHKLSKIAKNIVDLSVIWKQSANTSENRLGFSEKIIIPEDKISTLGAITTNTLTIQQIREHLLQPDEYVVRCRHDDTYYGFSEETFNDMISAIYSSPQAFADIPQAWNVKHRTTITDYIELCARNTPDPEIRIVEIASGRCSERWIEVLKKYTFKKPLHITLLDYNEEIVREETEKIRKSYSSKKHKIDFGTFDCLHDPVSSLPEANIIFAFYLLDSLQFADDRIWRIDADHSLQRESVMIKGLQVYRIRVCPYDLGTEKAKLLAESLSHALADKTPMPVLTLEEVRALRLERVVIPQGVETWNPGRLLWRMESKGTAEFLKSVKQRLRPKGKMLFGDTFIPESSLATYELIGRKAGVVYKGPVIESLQKYIPEARFVNAGKFAEEIRAILNQSLYYRFFGCPYQKIEHIEWFMEITND
jgi:hypothetical protein